MSKDTSYHRAERIIEIYDEMADALPGYYIPFFGTVIADDDVRGRKTSIRNMLYRNEKCTMSQIKKKFEVSAGQATKLVNPIVDDGFIERVIGKDDRRKVYLQLSEKGRTVMEKLLTRVTTMINFIIMLLDDDEQKQLISLLDKIVEGAKENIPAIKEISDKFGKDTLKKA